MEEISKKLGWHVHKSDKNAGRYIQLKFGKHVILEQRSSIEKTKILGKRKRTGNVVRQFKRLADQYTASGYEPSSRKEVRDARKAAKVIIEQTELNI